MAFFTGVWCALVLTKYLGDALFRKNRLNYFNNLLKQCAPFNKLWPETWFFFLEELFRVKEITEDEVKAEIAVHFIKAKYSVYFLQSTLRTCKANKYDAIKEKTIDYFMTEEQKQLRVPQELQKANNSLPWSWFLQLQQHYKQHNITNELLQYNFAVAALKDYPKINIIILKLKLAEESLTFANLQQAFMSFYILQLLARLLRILRPVHPSDLVRYYIRHSRDEWETKCKIGLNLEQLDMRAQQLGLFKRTRRV